MVTSRGTISSGPESRRWLHSLRPLFLSTQPSQQTLKADGEQGHSGYCPFKTYPGSDPAEVSMVNIPEPRGKGNMS